MIRITNELLFKYFSGEATETEKRLISDWIKADEKHRKTYNNARDIYAAWLMQAPMEAIERYSGKQEDTTHKRKAWRMVRTTIAIAAALALFCISGYLLIQDSFETMLSETMNTIVVPAGKSMDYILNDGTVIRLNSGAILQYPMVFSKDHREVHLEGEAYFNVAHNAEQPFIVKTFASDITVLGTQFNVNADEDKGFFSTTLVEGSIKLTSHLSKEEIIMIPDQTITLTDKGISINDKNSEITWINGILDIDTRDFNELMEKLETAFGVEIIIEREAMPEFNCVRGRFRISDGIDHAMKVLQDMIDFTYAKDYNTGRIYIR